MLGFGKRKVHLKELAAMLYAAVSDPEAERRDWLIVSTGRSVFDVELDTLPAERFLQERLAFRGFVTVSATDMRLRADDWQAVVDVFGALLAAHLQVPPSELQERLGRYVDLSNHGTEHLKYGTLAAPCREFALRCGLPKNAILIELADMTGLELAGTQLALLDSVRLDRGSFIMTAAGIFFRNGRSR
jgi:hypothetical protein